MILQLVEIKEFKKMSNGVSKFVSYKNNGRLYIFKDEKGKEYTKYSFNVWTTITKHRIKQSDVILNLINSYNDCGMISQAEELKKTEIPFEGDIFDFGFTYKLNQYNQNEIIKITKTI